MFVRAEISCSQTFEVGFVEGMEFQELSPSNEKWEDSVAPRTANCGPFPVQARVKACTCEEVLFLFLSSGGSVPLGRAVPRSVFGSTLENLLRTLRAGQSCS